jgi:hypothetical protein
MDTEARSEEFFYRVYDHVKGDTSEWIRDVSRVAREWGFNESEMCSFVSYYEGKRFVKAEYAVDGKVIALRLTSRGVDYVEHGSEY